MGKNGNSELVLLLANIGNSELGIADKALSLEEIQRKFESARQKALDEIQAILLEPAINEIFKMGIAHVKTVLFVTKQTPPHPQDAYHLGGYVKQILEHRHEGKIDIELDVIPLDPWHWDKMFKHYEERLSHLEDKLDQPRFVFISVSGGTPAQNVALLFGSVSIWEKKVQAIYKPRGSTNTVLFDVSRFLLKRLIAREIKALKEAKSFFSAALLGEKYDALSSEEIAFLRGEYYRNAFDFEKAIDFYGQAGIQGNSPRTEVGALIDKKDKLALLKELWRNMKVKHDQGEYVDFLGRLYRFGEETTQLIFAKVIGIGCERQGNRYPDFEKFIKENPKLCKEFENQRLRYEPNLRTLLLIFDFLLKESNIDVVKKAKLNKGLKLCKILNPLIELRNQTIIAHGFKGCSKEHIENKLKQDQIDSLEVFLDFLRQMLNELDRNCPLCTLKTENDLLFRRSSEKC